MARPKSKYKIRFKMRAAGQPSINVSCGAADMVDVRKKLRIFKDKGMPWAYDFKLYRVSDDSFVRDL